MEMTENKPSTFPPGTLLAFNGTFSGTRLEEGDCLLVLQTFRPITRNECVDVWNLRLFTKQVWHIENLTVHCTVLVSGNALTDENHDDSTD